MNIPVIYLDTCSIQRLLDDKSQPRIYLEAEAILAVLQLVEAKELELLSSDVLGYEISKIPSINRQSEAKALLKLSSKNAPVKPSTKALSEQIITIGVKPFDALNAAVAIENNVRFFCTCDDKLLKKLRSLDFRDNTKFVSPLELIVEVTT